MTRLQEGVTTVRFYQVAGSSLETALIGLLHKIAQQGLKACVLALDVNHVKRLDELLWHQPKDKFLAHGPWNGVQPHRQPILLALEPDDQNLASVLLVAAPGKVVEPTRFDMVVDFVTSQEPVTLTRDRYRHYQEQGCKMEYWLQTPDGRWQRKEQSKPTNQATSKP